MVYAPVVFDPDCASRLDADDPPPGVWNHDALDILGMYKSDWDRAHGRYSLVYTTNATLEIIMREGRLSKVSLFMLGKCIFSWELVGPTWWNAHRK